MYSDLKYETEVMSLKLLIKSSKVVQTQNLIENATDGRDEEVFLRQKPTDSIF